MTGLPTLQMLKLLVGLYKVTGGYSNSDVTHQSFPVSNPNINTTFSSLILLIR